MKPPAGPAMPTGPKTEVHSPAPTRYSASAEAGRTVRERWPGPNETSLIWRPKFSISSIFVPAGVARKSGSPDVESPMREKASAGTKFV